MIRFLAALLLLCAPMHVYSATQDAAAKGPLQIIKGIVSELIRINKEMAGEAHATERRAKLRTLINPHFDFAEMAKRSLGAHWTNCTQAEQDEFVKVFSDLLAKTYLERIDTVTSNVVNFEGEKITPPKAVVKTTITHKGDEFPIEYRLLDNNQRWMVYDVVIENISLIGNYRNEFAGVIRKEKFAGLLEKLKTKSQS